MEGSEQIQGLPPGATLKPIEGLPPGAEVRPIGQQETPEAGVLDKMKGNFNAATQGMAYKPGMSGTDRLKADVENVGAGGGDVIRSIGHAVLHPVDTYNAAAATEEAEDSKPFMQRMGDAVKTAPIGPGMSAAGLYGIGKGLMTQPARTIGQLGTGAILGEAAGEGMGAAKSLGEMARTKAIGDPDAAALRGLQVGARSPKTLSTLESVKGARPYLQGAKSLEDLQAKIQPAKDEIWSPYRQAVDAIGDRPVKGPDGMTTVRELENQRLQLSALNRGLKSGSPEALQLAQQKGMTSAQLLDQQKAVEAALDPALSSTGIDPQVIRKTFGNVSQVGSRMSGKSTMLEKPQPTGLGKMRDISLSKPLQAPGKLLGGLRDIAAGRPLFEAKPTDMGIREGFRMAGPKPDLGQYNPHHWFDTPTVKGLLPSPMESIPLHDPFSEPASPKMGFDARFNSSRMAEPLTTPEGNPNYGYSDQSPDVEGASGVNQQGVLRRRSQSSK